MNAEGGLEIELLWDGRRVQTVDLGSARPLHMVRLLHGKPVHEGLGMLGLIYRICGVAQRYTGLQAWCKATDAQAPVELQMAQEGLLKLESVREHLYQVLVTWPGLLGTAPQAGSGLSLLSRLMGGMEQALFAGPGLLPASRLSMDRQACSDLLKALKRLLEEQVLAMPVNEWQQLATPEAISAWAEGQQTPAACMLFYLQQQNWQGLGGGDNSIRALPPLPAEELSKKLSGEGASAFIARPDWQGDCHETTAYSRQAHKPLVQSLAGRYGGGMLVRVVARLLELVEFYEDTQRSLSALMDTVTSLPESSALQSDSGSALAMVEAARGRLVHRLRLERGVIVDYAILAPTEWNFHPQGIAAQGLKSLQAGDEKTLRQQAALWIHAIDPCVNYELKVSEVAHA